MIFFISFLLFLINFLIIKALYRIFRNNPDIKSTAGSKISVVVAARNEGKKLMKLVCSFRRQQRYISEIIIVDDYSSDNTFKTGKELFDDEVKFRRIKNELPPGKKNALSTGIKNSESEYILITDADCQPEINWAKSFLEKFSQGYDILFGIAPYKINDTFTGRISAFENLRGSILSFSALFFGFPYSAAARSFGFRKTSFERIYGYDKTMEVPFGDDDLLIREAVKNRLKIGSVTDENSFVYTNPKADIKEYLIQRKRHVRSSFYYSFKSQLLLAIWHITNLLPFLLLFFTPYNYMNAIPLILKLAFDGFILINFQNKFGYSFNIIQLVYLQLIYEFFVIIHFFNALTGKIRWK